MHSDSASGTAWAQLPPGPELTAILDSADPVRLDDDALIELITARHRLVAAAQAAELSAIAELARRRAGTSEAEFVNSELSCALRITPSAAGACLDFAAQLTIDRPAAFGALSAGLIDWPKARVFTDELAGIDPDLAGRIETSLLPQAPLLTSAQLRGRVRRLIDKADPDAADRRKRLAVASRDLSRWKNREGTWTISIRHLQGTTAGHIQARIAARARALKADGDPRPLHQIRADLATAILLGDYPGGFPGSAAGGDPHGAGGAGGTGDGAGPGPVPAAEETREPGDPAIGEPLDDATTGHPESPFPQPVLKHNETTAPDDQTEPEPGDGDAAGQRKALDAVTVIIAGAMSALLETIRSPGSVSRASLAAEAITRQFAGAKGVSCVNTKLSGGKIMHGRPVYRPPPSMRKHVQARDQRCRFPTCNRRAQYCDEDHTIPYHCGGATCPCNLASLCRHHHRAKQNKEWHIFHPWPGVLIWITPNGHWYLS